MELIEQFYGSRNFCVFWTFFQDFQFCEDKIVLGNCKKNSCGRFSKRKRERKFSLDKLSRENKEKFIHFGTKFWEKMKKKNFTESFFDRKRDKKLFGATCREKAKKKNFSRQIFEGKREWKFFQATFRERMRAKNFSGYFF